MNSSTTRSFRDGFANLAPEIQELSRKTFRMWLVNPRHPSLHFKKIGAYWSVRIGGHHRAVGRMDGDTLYWFWIGPHDEYARIIRL